MKEYETGCQCYKDLDFNGAAHWFEQAVNYHDHEDDAMEYLALCQFQLEEFEKCRQTCTAIVQAHPKNATAWCVLGLSQLRLNQLEEAERSLHKAVSLQADLFAAWQGLVRALNLLGKNDKAQAALGFLNSRIDLIEHTALPTP